MRKSGRAGGGRAPAFAGRLALPMTARALPPILALVALLGLASPAAAQSLAASNIEANSATITLTRAGYTGDWYYTDVSSLNPQCSSAVSGSSTNLAGLDAGTGYAFRAYRDAQCASILTESAAFTTKPGQAGPLTISRAISRLLVRLKHVKGAEKYQLEWKYGSLGYDDDARRLDVGAGWNTYDHEIRTVGVQIYTFRLRAGNGSGWGAWSEEASAAPVCSPCASLTASNYGGATATLTIGNHTGNWYYKANAAPDNSCKGPVSTASGNLAGLSGNTSYTYKAYGDSACSIELATAGAFLTRPGKPTKPAATAGAGSGTLTLSASVTGGGTLTGWQYRQKEGSGDFGDWQDVPVTSRRLSHVVAGLTDGADYRFRVRAVNATGDGATSDASDIAQPSVETLTASSVTHNSATLTIGNHSGDWYYRADAGPDDSCTGPVGTATVELAGLSPGMSYTYTVCSDSTCSTELATVTLRTRPSAMPRLGRPGAALAPEAARAMASSAVEAVSERLRRAGSGEAGPPPARTLAERLAAHGEGLEDGTVSLREAYAGASLSLPLAAAEGGGGAGVSGAAFWASGDWRDLSGGGPPLAWDGAMAALHLGADARLGSGLVGLALSVSEASFDYSDGSGGEAVTGEYTVRMTGLAPYWGRSWADGSRLWATAGLSSGEVEIEDAEAGRQAADSGMASLAAGGALRLVPAAESGAPSLELKGEALAARLEVEGNGGPMEAVDAGVSRLRVALASEIEIEAGMPGAPLVPSAELGLVWDGGDGETGAGLELGWGLSWAAPSQGLTLDARARTLSGSRWRP